MVFIRKIKVGKRTYLAEVKSVREGGKVRQKFIRYIGKEVSGMPVRRVATSDVAISSVKQSLNVLCVDKAARELGITTLPNKYFLALVYSQLLEKRSINKLEEWLHSTEIPDVLSLSNITTKELYESLNAVSEQDFLSLDEHMNRVFAEHEKVSDVAVIDVTDTYFEGSTQEGVRRKGKEGKVKKLLQIGLATSFENGFPLFYKTYHGNLSNMHIYKDMILETQRRGLHAVIVDRGMTSFDNIQLTLKLHTKMIGGVRKTTTLINKFIKKVRREKIYAPDNRVKLKNTAVFIQSFPYLHGELIVVYNPSLEVVKKELNFEKGIANNIDVGYALIYNNTAYDSKVAVKKYYEKDVVERSFKQLKGILNLRPVRVWLKTHVEGHVRACYLAYAILSLMQYRLRKSGISAVNALDSLKTGYRVTLNDRASNFQWEVYVPLAPKQQKILKALDVVYKK